MQILQVRKVRCDQRGEKDNLEPLKDDERESRSVRKGVG